MMSNEDLIDMCKEHEIDHSGSKKKLAEKLLDIIIIYL